MKASTSELHIPAVKRVFLRLAEYSRKNKYFLLIGVLVLATPVVVGLTFAESEEVDGEDTSEVASGDDEGEILGEAVDGEVDENDEDEESDNETDEEDVDDKDEESDDEADEETEDELDAENDEDKNDDEKKLIEAIMANYRSPRVATNRSATRRSVTYGGHQSSSPVWGWTFEYEFSFPSYYNSREQLFGQGIITKNQNTENICWAYSMASSMEYYLSKNGLANIEISPKHLDYQNVPASIAYKQSDVTAGKTNAIYDRIYLYDKISSLNSRVLGEGATDDGMILAAANPLAIMSDSDFTSAIRTNDSRLPLIGRYEDIWTTGLDSTVLTAGVYAEKQNYGDMNNVNKTKFVVTDAGIIYYGTYGESDLKTNVVNAVKTAVKNYGAVSVGTFWDEDNCMNYGLIKDESGQPVVDENGTYRIGVTIIDRGVNVCDTSTGHEMTIVGWNDSWTYDDNGVEKTGAFILQDSVGDQPIINVQDGTEKRAYVNTYLSYNSAIDVIYFSSIERLTDYDHYYSADDYNTPTITAGDKELIFEFTSHGSETLKSFSFTDFESESSEYEVYVSRDGTVDGFVKDGTISVQYGIDKYSFNNDIVVNGDYAIKLKMMTDREWDEYDRALSVITVFTNDYGIKTFTLTLDANNGSFPDVPANGACVVSCTTTETSCDVEIPDAVPSFEESIFVGWANTNTSLVSDYKSGDTVTLTGDKTLYAVYSSSSDPLPGPEPGLSSNAYLHSITVHYKINGEEKVAEIEPRFDKDITEYKVYIPEGYDKETLSDEAPVVVEIVRDDVGANVVVDKEVIEEQFMEIMTINVTAQDGVTQKVYKLNIYYQSSTVPDTGDDTDLDGDTPAPRVPDTGFIIRDKSDSAERGGSSAVIVIIGLIMIGIMTRVFVKKAKIENEAIIFVKEE